MTWEELFGRLAASRRLAPSTLEGYLECWRYFFRQWPDLKGPLEISEHHLAEFYRTQLRAPGISSNTAGARLRALLIVLRWAHRQGHLLVNPGQSLSVPKPRRPLARVLTQEEVQRLLLVPLRRKRYFTRYRDVAIVELLYGTGIRGGELVALDLEDLDLADALLKIRGGKGKPRFLPLSAEVVTALSRYLQEARLAVALEGETAVFVSQQGSRLSSGNLSAQIRSYGRQLDIEDVTPHAFRRAVATHLLENGAQLPEIKALLGHEDISSTQAYAQVVPVEMLREHRRTHPCAHRGRRSIKPGGPRES